MKKVLIVTKFGGSVLDDIELVVNRISHIKKESQVGPIIVVSAPKIRGEKARSLTDIAIEVGESYAKRVPMSIDQLFQPYEGLASLYLKGVFKEAFNKELLYCKERVIQALNQSFENRMFVDVNRARVLAYSGEVLMAALMDYILKSRGFDSVHFSLQEWPIVTDENFESANFLRKESEKRAAYLESLLELGKVLVVGGYIGVTVDGLETTFERGGSDRTAADLAIMLSNTYRVSLDFEKNDVVLSADPSIVKEGLEPVWRLSYNEATLAGMFGMKIIDPSAIRDIQEAELDIPIAVTDIKNPVRTTKIIKNIGEDEGNPVKIVTGRKDCTILELSKSKRDSLEDYLRSVRRFEDFFELRPYRRGKDERARFLILDAAFLRRHGKELLSFDRESYFTTSLGAITLIGDRMGQQVGVAAKAFSAVFESGINIEDGDIQQPTSSILILVKNESLAKAVRAIHARTRLAY